MRIADTSVLYAVFDADDAWHAKATQAIQRPQPLLVPREILGETLALIQQVGGFEAAQAALDYLRQMPTFRLAPTVQVAAVAAQHARAEGRLSYHDAVVVETARALAVDALTFDKEIQKAPR